MANRNSGSHVVPEAKQALQQMKMEAASQLGIAFAQDGYYGDMTSRDAGSIGGEMTRRLVAMAEQTLAGRSIR